MTTRILGGESAVDGRPRTSLDLVGLLSEQGYYVMGTAELLDRARRAFAECAWQDAYDDFDEADRTSSLEPPDLERCATAAYLTGHDTESTDAWSRAHEGWHERGDEQRAVRCAFWLGFALLQRGDMAQGGGWLGRAGRMVDEHQLDTVERGYLLVPTGLMAMGAGEPETALERFAEAESLARRFGDQDLDALGKLGQGQAMLCMGRMPEGLRLFDEAMVAVTAGETSPVISGLVYCAVIDTCQRVFDLRRAREWTAALDRWCEQQPGLVPYRGQCLVHRAQVLQLRGQWAAAIVEAEQARQRLSEPPNPAVGMAHYQLGELHRLRGETPQAEAAYRKAHAAGREPQPGLALLRLSEGRAEIAAAAIESALDAARDHMSRAQLLPAHAEIMLAAGRVSDARAAADELDELAAGENATMLGAIANETRARLLLVGGDARAALGSLRDATRRTRSLRCVCWWPAPAGASGTASGPNWNAMWPATRSCNSAQPQRWRSSIGWSRNLGARPSRRGRRDRAGLSANENCRCCDSWPLGTPIVRSRARWRSVRKPSSVTSATSSRSWASRTAQPQPPTRTTTPCCRSGAPPAWREGFPSSGPLRLADLPDADRRLVSVR